MIANTRPATRRTSRWAAKWVGRAAVIIATAVAANPAGAQGYVAKLSGPAENPPNASPGTGLATMLLAGNMFTVNATFSGLQGTTAAAHIHCCVAPPGNVGVATQVPSFLSFPVGVTSGSYTNMFDLSLASTYNPAFITANGGTVATARTAFVNGLNLGTSYFNIHTSVFPGGEIRGFITVVPEPASVLLVASGLFAVGVIARRRQRGA